MKNTPQNRLGEIHGDWKVIALAGVKPSRWTCECVKCKATRVVRVDNLRTLTICTACKTWREDLTGKKFNDWTVLSFSHVGESSGNPGIWNCRCKCGTVAKVYSGNLQNGRSPYCRKCRIKKRRGPHDPGPWNELRGFHQKHVAHDCVPEWRKLKDWYLACGKDRTKKKPFLRKHDKTKPHGPENSYWYERNGGYTFMDERAVAVLVALGSTEAAAWKRIKGLTRERIRQIARKGDNPCTKCGKPWWSETGNPVCVKCRGV